MQVVTESFVSWSHKEAPALLAERNGGGMNRTGLLSFPAPGGCLIQWDLSVELHDALGQRPDTCWILQKQIPLKRVLLGRFSVHDSFLWKSLVKKICDHFIFRVLFSWISYRSLKIMNYITYDHLDIKFDSSQHFLFYLLSGVTYLDFFEDFGSIYMVFVLVVVPG